MNRALLESSFSTLHSVQVLEILYTFGQNNNNNDDKNNYGKGTNNFLSKSDEDRQNLISCALAEQSNTENRETQCENNGKREMMVHIFHPSSLKNSSSSSAAFLVSIFKLVVVDSRIGEWKTGGGWLTHVWAVHDDSGCMPGGWHKRYEGQTVIEPGILRQLGLWWIAWQLCQKRQINHTLTNAQYTHEHTGNTIQQRGTQTTPFKKEAHR